MAHRYFLSSADKILLFIVTFLSFYFISDVPAQALDQSAYPPRQLKLDLNQDGHPDLLVYQGEEDAYQTTIYLAQPKLKGHFSYSQKVKEENDQFYLLPFDLNGDGKIEFLKPKGRISEACDGRLPENAAHQMVDDYSRIKVGSYEPIAGVGGNDLENAFSFGFYFDPVDVYEFNNQGQWVKVTNKFRSYLVKRIEIIKELIQAPNQNFSC